MRHIGVPPRQVEGYTKRGVSEQQVEGTPASEAIEEGCWRALGTGGARVLGALMLLEKQMFLLILFECNSSCLLWVLSKTVNPDPKVHDQDVTVASHGRTGGPPAAHSPSFLYRAAVPHPSFHLSLVTLDVPGAGQGHRPSSLPLPQGHLKPPQ